MPDVKQPAAAFSVPLISLAFSSGRGPARRSSSPSAPRAARGLNGWPVIGAASPEARMANNMSHLPPLPQIGHPESYYARLAKQAEREGDIHAHEAAKVGQYITLALDPNIDWDAKRRYFRHAIKRHCAPPQVSSELVEMYYIRLTDLVMHHAGAEALRLASAEDDKYASRLSDGRSRRTIMEDAMEFFANLMGVDDSCPSHFKDEDWLQLRIIRNQWIPEPGQQAPGDDGQHGAGVANRG
jgi:hypothetical protein